MTKGARRVNQDDQIQMAQVASGPQEDLLRLVHWKTCGAESRRHLVAPRHESGADQTGPARVVLVIVQGREHRNALREPGKPPAQEPGRGDVRENPISWQNGEPRAKVPVELIVNRRGSRFRKEQPVADATEPSLSDMPPNRFVITSHGTRLGPQTVAE